MTFHSIGLVLVMGGIVANKIMLLEVPFKIQSKEAIGQNLRENLFVRLYSVWSASTCTISLLWIFRGTFIKTFYYTTQKICFDDSSIRKLTGKRTDPTSNCSNWKLKIIQGFVDTVTQFYFGSWILYGIVSMLCELFVLSRSSSKLNISRHSKLLNQIRKLKKSNFLYIK